MKHGFIVAILLLAVLTGCRSSAVYNVVDAPVVTQTNARYAQGDVGKAIVRAGAQLGWQMIEHKPGFITGTLNLRSHQAIVDIPYSRDKYSIIYRDSTNLHYDGDSIHSNYNNWIQRLDNAIKTQLTLI